MKGLEYKPKNKVSYIYKIHMKTTNALLHRSLVVLYRTDISHIVSLYFTI